MPIPRPKSIWLLIIVFAWSAYKGIEILARGNSTADRILFDHAGLGWLFVPQPALFRAREPLSRDRDPAF